MSARRPGGDPSVGFDDSWYFATSHPTPRRAPLRESIEVDVCVIGAGYTGLSAALELADAGFTVAVLEAHRVGAGASGRNGGVLGMGQRKDQIELEARFGSADAKLMWQIACDANQLVRDRVKKYAIDCDLKDGELHVAHKARYTHELHEYANYLAQHYDYPHQTPMTAAEVADVLGSDRFHGGCLDARAGHIHPLNYALGLAAVAEAKGAAIYETSRAHDYQAGDDHVTVITDSGRVRAQFLIIACNGYLGRFERRIDQFQMPINNFILATEPLGEERARAINSIDAAVVDTRFVVNYFHNSPDHRLIFGGGENYSSRFPADLKSFVRKRMLRVYPQLEGVAIDYAWGGTLAVTMNRMPNFGRINPNIYWAQGYSGHGIAMANMGGKLVAEAITGHAERFDVFANRKQAPFPGGRWLRWPALVAGMLFYKMLDKV